MERVARPMVGVAAGEAVAMKAVAMEEAEELSAGMGTGTAQGAGRWFSLARMSASPVGSRSRAVVAAEVGTAAVVAMRTTTAAAAATTTIAAAAVIKACKITALPVPLPSA